MAEQIGNKFDFTGRRVLVTGGGRGIGKVTVREFLKSNATVIVLDKDEELLNKLKEEFPRVTTIKVDITDWNLVEKAVAPILPIHHLVNNAGIMGSPTPFLELAEATFDAVCNLNLKAVVRVAQVVARGMVEHKIEGGTIVNISSIACVYTPPKILPYSSTKAAVDHATKTMALELAPYKIRANAVQPGACTTEMLDSLPEEEKNRLINPTLEKQVYHHATIDPVNISNAIMYLSSPMSEMITGTVIRVDAGFGL